MRIVLDTNLLVSALIVRGGVPEYLYQCWRTGRFTLITSDEQLEEFRRVTRYPKVRKYIRPAAAGTMLSEIRALAKRTGTLSKVNRCSLPWRRPVSLGKAQGEPDDHWNRLLLRALLQLLVAGRTTAVFRSIHRCSCREREQLCILNVKSTSAAKTNTRIESSDR